MVKKSTYVMLAILVVLLLLLIADPSQSMETVYLCTEEARSGGITKTATYDANGNILFIEESKKGNSYITHRFTYDDQNNLLSKTWYNNKGEVREQCTYAYGQYQTIVTYYEHPEYTISAAPDNAYTFIYTYDAFGNQISLKLYTNHNNALYIENTRTYDLLGNLLTDITYQEGRETGNYRYTYDARGNRLTYASYSDGEETFRYEYSYDNNGNCIGNKYYTKNVLTSETKNTLDERGNIIEAFTENIKKGETYTTKYTYDSQNRLLSEEFFNNGYVNRKTYEYDFAGNLIYRYRFETSYKPLSSSTEYKYIAIRVPAEQAKKIREMQTELFSNQPE